MDSVNNLGGNESKPLSKPVSRVGHLHGPLIQSGMTRDHPIGNTPLAQHPLPRGGLAIVARAHKCSHSRAASLQSVDSILWTRVRPSPRRMDVYKAVQDVMVVRDRLGPEERSRFDIQYLRTNAMAKDLAERHEELSLIPIGHPDTVPK